MREPRHQPTVAWRVSSYSGSSGGNCVEAGPVLDGWRVSSYSGSGGGNCVEAGTDRAAGLVAVRDTKHRAGGMLVCPAAGWSTFVAALPTNR